MPYSRHTGYQTPPDTQPDMSHRMNPLPNSIQGTMDFIRRSPLEQLQLEGLSAASEGAQLSLPAPTSGAFLSGAAPYVNNHHDSLFRKQRALSQAGYYPLASPMHRNMSNCSEPIMLAHSQMAPFLTSGGRRISHEMLGSPLLAQVCGNPPPPEVGMTPIDYIGTIGASYLSSTGTNLSSQDMYAGDRLSSVPPSMVTASSGAEAALPMTRENSYVHSGSPADIVRVASYASYAADPPFGQSPSDLQQLDSCGPFKMGEALMAVGGGFPNSTLPQYSAAEYQTFPSPTSAPMERGGSTCSIKSTASSVERRAREAFERALRNGNSTSIAPMPQELPQQLKREPPPVAHERRTITIQEVTKAKQKPKYPKLRCDRCNEIPDGFRGDHELRRHISAKHVQVVKKYVCRDPTEVGLPTDLKVLYPLSRCKACASGKQYGAYYNAAAHLRRTHFRVRPNRGRAGTAIGERRGGKGGGDWPPMAELKAWFEEIHVSGEGPASLVTGDDPPDEGSLSPASVSTTNMNNNADPLGYGDVYDPFGDHAFDSNNMPVSYVDQSAQEDADLGMLSDLNSSDIDMFTSSQDSVTSPDFENMGTLSFGDTWLDASLMPI